jgi:pyruvate/2-oxoglutarate dehydrogenase complex dihydrolipoamide acyltransferase (E2) component
MALPAGIRSGTPEALQWVLAQAAAMEEASALGLTVAGSGPTARGHKARAAVAAANKASHPRFWARTDADELGVTLSEVTGTGTGGMILAADIRAAAGLVPDPVAQSVTAPAPSARFAASGPMSANPLVAKAHAERPGQAVKAAAKAPAPTMFASGDLPAFTASGIDPQVLTQVPWNARHTLAQASTATDAYKIVEDFVGMDPVAAEIHASAAGYQGDDARYYQARVGAWVTDGMSDGEIYKSIGYAADDASRA